MADGNFMWNNDVLFKLIDLYRERPQLWDPTDIDNKVSYVLTTTSYAKDRNKKHACWQEIAEYFNMDRTVVEKKMRMLVGQYRREQTKVAAGETSKWFAYKNLSFLRPAATGGSSSSNHSFAENFSVFRNNNDTEEDKSNTPVYEEEDHSEDRIFVAPVQKIMLPKRQKIEPKTPQTCSADVVLKMLCQERISRDEFMVFGEYVANKLRNIHSQHARNTAQFHINKILYHAETGHYDPVDGARSDSKKAPETNSTPRMPRRAEENAAATASRWDIESLTSLTDSVHSLGDIIEIKEES